MESLIVAMSVRTSTDDTHVTNQFLEKLAGKISQSTKDAVDSNVLWNRWWVIANSYYDFATLLESRSWEQDAFEEQHRLPSSSVPQYYKLHIDARNIHDGSTDFKGEVEIEVLVMEPTEHIMFHSKEQVIEDLKVFYKNGSAAPLLDHSLYTGFLFEEGKCCFAS